METLRKRLTLRVCVNVKKNGDIDGLCINTEKNIDVGGFCKR